MKGLLRKDWYSAIKLCKSFFLVILVFLGVAVISDENSFFIIFPCVTAGLVPMTLLSYEEHDGWDKYAGTLPYTRAQIVSSKYLFGLFGNVIVGILIAIVQAYKMSSAAAFTFGEYISVVFILLSASFISPAILYPFLYKFGTTKGRIVYYILIGAVYGTAMSLSTFDTPFVTFAKLNSSSVVFGVAVTAVSLYAVSWLLSIHFYKKREL